MKWLGAAMMAMAPIAAIAYGIGWYEVAHGEFFLFGVGLTAAGGFALVMITGLDDQW